MGHQRGRVSRIRVAQEMNTTTFRLPTTWLVLLSLATFGCTDSMPSGGTSANATSARQPTTHKQGMSQTVETKPPRAVSPQTPVTDLLGAKDAVAAAEVFSHERDLESSRPLAVIENHVHDFGNMQPFQKRQHRFVVRNDGTAPLTIRAGESSCKCTIGEVESDIVPPGGTSTVLLSWHTTTETKLFAHEAEVLTNDPDHPVLTCRVQGTVLQLVEISPQAFRFSGVAPGTSPEMSVTIASQVWDRFEIQDLVSSHKDIEIGIQPLTEPEKKARDAQDGYVLTVKLPNNLGRGEFNESLRLRLVPDGQPAETLMIPVNGRILRRVAIYGKGIDSYGRVNLGRVPVGKGIQRNFSVKVRDPDPTLAVKKVTTVPDYVQVHFSETKFGVPGLYKMTIEVPPSAPASYITTDQGRLHIEFENARFDDLDLSVAFAVGGDS